MNKKIIGRYTNSFDIGHNAFEFIIDCGQFFSEENEVINHTRIITSPVYAAALLQALKSGLQNYKEKYGEIAQYDDAFKEGTEVIC